ncbi:MAG: hypothetical protein HQ553_14215 [Chloroflexi bacterium]|nr:hypothetical protein [Chloroflexota bacterium]
MMTKIRLAVIFLIVLMLLTGNLNSALLHPTTLVSAEEAAGQGYSAMILSSEELQRWIEHRESLPEANVVPKFESQSQMDLGAGEGSYSLLNHLEYVPIERDQGDCGDCWQWAGTGILEIAQDAQIGIKDRLSIQYMNSCGGCGCSGGILSDVVDFYNTTGKAIPWSNTNAAWQDGDESCDTSCGSVSATPYYPITSIAEERVSTWDWQDNEMIEINQATAISEVKNILDQDKAIQLGMIWPNTADFTDWALWWLTNDEDDIWNPDYSSGHTWVEGEGSGHAILVVGYNDGPGTDSDYWVLLNSWGTTPNRPNGLFRLDMNLDYGSYALGTGYPKYPLLWWETLDVTFPATPELVLSSATYDTEEDAGSATITVNLSETAPYPITVDYSTSDGTATAGTDYTATYGTLTFDPGDTTETFSVPITDDSVFEADETVNLTLGNPNNASLGSPNAATLTITSNDVPEAAFSSVTYSVAENVSSGTATITVNLSQAIGDTVTVNYATGDGTALAISDYTTTSGTLTFAAGVTSQTFDIPMVDDTIAEDMNETVILSLTSSGYAIIGSPNPATLTIQDDDAPDITFSSATYPVTEGIPTATIEAILSGTSTATVSVGYSTSDGTATGGIDYSTSSGTLTFSAGDTSKTFTVSINDDAFVELDETVNLTLSNPVNAVLGGTTSATLTISSDDVSSVFLATDSYGVSEDGSSVNIAVMISPTGHPAPITVNYATSDGSALASVDYIATSGTLTFEPDDFLESFSVSIIDDGIAEGDETISLTLSNANNANLVSPGTATLTIFDDDAPDITFSSGSYTVAENVASGTATIAVVLSGTSTQTIVVNYATSDGTATGGTDYTAVSGTLSFAAGDTSKTFSIAINDDGIAEGSETIDLQLSNAANANLGTPSTATLTILDDDAPDVVFSSVTYNVAEGTPTATITTILSGTSAATITVNYVTSDGTAIAGSDYTATSGTSSFAAGDTSKTFTIPIIDDITVEADETVSLTLSNPVDANLGTPNSATLIISSSDVPEVAFSTDAYSVAENVASGTATITVELSQSPLSLVTVNYASSDGTATRGSDYTTVSGTLSFAAGDTSETFSVPITDDSDLETNETVTLTLSNPSGATLGIQNTATLTITNDDVVAPTVITNAASNIGETTVTLNGTLGDLGGAPTVTVFFEWGTNASYSNSTDAVVLDSPNSFTANLSGLQAGMTYQFKAKATNDGGSSYGYNYLFTTNAAPSGGGAGGGGGAAAAGGGGGGGVVTPINVAPISVPKSNPAPIPKSAPVSIPEPPVTAPPPAPVIELPSIVTIDLANDASGVVTTTAIVRSDAGECNLTIPEGTESKTREGEALSQITMEAMEELPSPSENSNIIGVAYDFGPDGATFDPPIPLNFTYDDSILPEGTTEANLVIAVWDSESGTWIELESVVDPNTNTIITEISHFSIYSIIVRSDIAEDALNNEAETIIEPETTETPVVNWAILGMIIAGALVFIAAIVSLIMLRERRALRHS